MNVVRLIKRKRFAAGLSKIAASANVMIENERGELLVLKANYKSYWSLPGGWIDKGESPRQAAKREVKEEIGCDIDEMAIDLIRVIHRQSVSATTYQFVFALKSTMSGQAEFKLQPSEIDACDWVSKDEVVNSKDGRKYNRSVLSWATDEPSYIESTI